MGIFSSLFKKNRYKAEVEDVFDVLLKQGFNKQFTRYGAEWTLTYTKDKIKLSLIWETLEGNPGVILTAGGIENLLDFTTVETKLREKHTSLPANPNRYHYWLFNILTRKEYLETMKEDVLNKLATIETLSKGE